MRHLYTYSLLAVTFTTIAAAQIVLDPNPARVLGHPTVAPAEQLLVTNLNPNFGTTGGMYSPQGVAVDTTGSTPILYVADTGNNRILAWKNATSGTLKNAQAPDLIIGQPDANTTIPSINGGLHYPSGLLVDLKGNLYVADSGNNRVLRYPAPFSNSNASPDIVIGQPDKFTSNRANQGGAISAQTICFYDGCPLGSGPFFSTMAMDNSGDLFVVDAGNSRVLRYPAASLIAGANGPSADLVIGQAGFTKVLSPTGLTDKNTLSVPAGIALDSSGRLFVTDSYNRMVVFPSSVTSAQPTNGPAAIRLAGIVNPAPATATANTLLGPEGIVMINNGPAVADSGDNRLLIFDAYTNSDWGVTSGDTTLSTPPPTAIAVLGQGASTTDFTTSLVNAGNPQASFTSNGTKIPTYNHPVAAAVAGTDLFVVDAYNHRVLVYANAGQTTTASVVLGQSDFPYDSPNSIHGREFYFGPNPANSSYDAGIVVDSSSGTPHLYISDPNNNRVLGFADARKVAPGVQADIVIGEPDLATSLCNFGGIVNPTNESLPRQPTNASLCYPTGLAVDPATGDLWVADSSNGRVLRFPAPFEPVNFVQQANLVFGQPAFTGISNPQASQSTMVYPYGLVFDAARGLLVSDAVANRVLLFSLKSPTNGEQASAVIGQSNFVATTNNVLSSPHHIAEDSIAELYVADTGHNQIQVFNIPSGTTSDQPVNSYTGLNGPQAVWVNQSTVLGYHDDVWVGDNSGLSRFAPPNPLGSNAATLRMPVVEVSGPNLTCTAALCEYPAIAVTQDSYGALYVADYSNRVSIHYPALAADNGGNFQCAMGCTLGGLADQTYYLAPGAFASIFAFNGSTFATTTTVNYVLPVPTTLGGVQVLVNGQASPITTVAPGQINFVLPFEAPTSGTTPVMVVNASTSQVLGSGTLTMNTASPGFFTSNQAGTGQIAALNCNVVNGACDNTVNGSAHPVQQGSLIQLYLTGQGQVQGAPPDGQGPSGTVSTGSVPVVYVGASQATVQFSGLAPGYPGLWQINVQIPSGTALKNLPGFSTGIFPVQVYYEGLLSTLPATNNANPSTATTIVVNAPE